MPALDRAALRMGTAELITRADVPTAVVLNETVELASRFSTDDSGRFVNGLLAKIATEVAPRVIELPDPPLRSGRPGRCGPWRRRATRRRWSRRGPTRRSSGGPACPTRRDLAAAERWIAGDEERRRRELSLDLVVERDGEVAGEVGPVVDRPRRGTVPRSAGGRPPPTGDRASRRPRRRSSCSWARDGARARLRRSMRRRQPRIGRGRREGRCYGPALTLSGSCEARTAGRTPAHGRT